MNTGNILTPEQLDRLNTALRMIGLDASNFSTIELDLLYNSFVSMPYESRSSETAIHAHLNIIDSMMEAIHRSEVYKTIAGSVSLQTKVKAMGERVLYLDRSNCEGSAA